MATEKFTVSGEELVGRFKKLLHEGNIRTVRIIQGGKVILEVPLTVGASAATLTIMMAPILAAIGALAALITECTIEVEKVEGE
jgi:hypothetical protein